MGIKLLSAVKNWWATRRPKVVWYEPRWSYTPALWRSLKRATAPASVLRVTVLTALCSAAVVFGFKLAVPLLQLQPDLIWKTALALPGMYLYLLCMTGLHAAIPPRIEVRRDRVVVIHGQHPHVILGKEMARARLVVFEEKRIRLRIWYRFKLWKRQTLRAKTIGVSPQVNLQELCDLMPVAPEV
jgi:hypothetical protein